MWYIFYIFANMYIIIISLTSNGKPKQEKPHFVETRCTPSPFAKQKNFNIQVFTLFSSFDCYYYKTTAYEEP